MRNVLSDPGVPSTKNFGASAAGRVDGCCRDERELFAFEDPETCMNGWFGFRTVHSYLRIRSS